MIFLINVYNNICFGCIKKRLKEMFLLRAQNLCLIEKNLIIILFGGFIFLCLLPHNSNY